MKRPEEVDGEQEGGSEGLRPCASFRANTSRSGIVSLAVLTCR